jgi:hypothetical protein
MKTTLLESPGFRQKFGIWDWDIEPGGDGSLIGKKFLTP